MRKYVVTGGPGCGKSSIIRGLEIDYGKIVVRESAEDYILYRKALGEVNPNLSHDFESGIVKLLIQRESKLPFYLSDVFLDRGLPDVFGYEPEGTELYNESFKLARLQSHCVNHEFERPYDYDSNPLYIAYSKVFFIESLNNVESNNFRTEDYDKALKIGELIYASYKNLGYNVIRIPVLPLKDRIKAVLSSV